ncbi:uncharacterized protein LOC127846401 [Dreissena polymorpha]|uniref:Fibronectin type-III domain-containing protein n=1 Tax=Dreissena polymorpha TaxID=45954 RepID=A0A9D4IH40_DREPO|nr:uncharacterized protein LOC127846401 [Dreissena polymorpha]XP_052233577.1 uncharacterized protein LOC127846401 [Dreissena polymorpha]KAH3772282.1 hypothetical protein DPMN_173620 [Dreissena polymorpha]
MEDRNEQSNSALQNHDNLDSDESFESLSRGITDGLDASGNANNYTSVSVKRPRLLDLSDDETSTELGSISNENRSNEITVEQRSLQDAFTCAEIQNVGNLGDSKRALSCEPCEIQGKTSQASTFCPSCEKEMLCEICSTIHRVLPITKSHDLLVISEHPAYKQMENVDIPSCGLCLLQNVGNEASVQCMQCETFLCDACSKQHKAQKATRSHKLTSIVKTIDRSHVSCADHNDRELSQKNVVSPDTMKLKQPGRPEAFDITSDSLTLSWTKPALQADGDYFQIEYKELIQGSKWKTFTGEFTESTQILTNLKSETEFVFRVRALQCDGEGPYSEESAVVKTHISTASRLIGFSVRLDEETTSPIRYALPMCEVKEARNSRAKTRKF